MQPVIIPAPPSKSLSHRALMGAALAGGFSRLSHVLESDDTARTRDVFSALGAVFTRTGEGAFTVQGLGGRVRSRPDGRPLSVFVGESGTTCRLVLAVLAAGQGRFHIHGAGRMHERPVNELADVLEGLGARIRYEGRPGCPPLLLESAGLDPSLLPGDTKGGTKDDTEGGTAVIGCEQSSQYLSGLLLAAPLGKGLRILLGGEKAVSWPYVSLTLDALERFGVDFTVEVLGQDGWRAEDWRLIREGRPGALRFHVPPGAYRPVEHAVEGDWSGASYFLAAGAIGPKPVRVTGLNAASLQGDAALVDILERMGARVERDEAGLTVYPARLRGVAADMGHCPDLVPTVAALAAHATGVTAISNAAHLAIKESDRLAAPARELARVGCRVAVTADGLVIEPPRNGPARPGPETVFSAHNDHRMAMSLSLLGLAGLPRSAGPAGPVGQGAGRGFAVPLDNPDCVAKSFPHFWKLWEQVR